MTCARNRRAGLSKALLILALALMTVVIAGASRSHAAEGGTGLPAECAFKVEAVFWTGEDWQRLGRALRDDPSPCADYYISLPPLANDKTRLRVAQDDVIRALGPQFHPVAEMTLGGATAWGEWVEENGKSWFEAGVEFRRRMAAAGYDIEGGETWLVNEFNVSTRRDVEPFTRANMRELVRGLFGGDKTLPTSRGMVEIGINFSHQNLPDVPTYKAEVKAWLQDSAFWVDMDRHVRFMLREAYPDSRLWGVPESTLEQRVDHLSDYLLHFLSLAEAGPASIAPARDYLRKAFTPLANSGWASLGGDAFDFVTGHGNTIITPEQMMHFVSEQVYAMSRYALAHSEGAPQGRLGFSWQPVNRLNLPAREFAGALDRITERVARAIRWAYTAPLRSRARAEDRPGEPPTPEGACSPPASGEWWCSGGIFGARFTDAWRIFRSWE